jgi:hypothetical protein
MSHSDKLKAAVVLLGDLWSWHINQMDAPRALRELRERVVEVTGRVDLCELDSTDIGLHEKLIDAVDDFLDSHGS